MSNLFGLIRELSSKNSSNTSRVIIEEEYNPFIAGRYFSHFIDTVAIANEVNLPNLDKIEHYQFLYYMIPSRNRPIVSFSNPKQEEQVARIMKLYDYSELKAMQAIKTLGIDAINTILEAADEGGMRK